MTKSSGNPRTLRSDIVFTYVLALACYLAWFLRDVLVMFYVSALFAVVLSPVVNSISRVSIGRWKPFKGSAVFFLVLLVAAALVAFGFLALPPVIQDLEALGGELPTRLPPLLEQIKHLPFADKLHTVEISSRLQDLASQGVSYFLRSIGDWAGKLSEVVIGFTLSLYFILEGDSAYRWFLSFFAPEPRNRLDRTLKRAEVRMGRWLIGQGSLMLIMGVTSTVVYLSLHLRYAYALGVLTGLLNIIPVLGAASCVALALVVAAIDSWGRVLGVAIFYVIYLQVENAYLTPRIMKNSVGLPGLAILAALLLGAALEGIVGALVSVPTAVLVSVLLDEYLVHKDTA
jgi:predicted PurR-regulated permease PerM